MIALIKIAIPLLSDVCGLVILLFRPRGAMMAENLFQRRQLALYREGSVTPHRIDAAARIRLTLLPRPFDWRAALVVVRPETLVRWHPRRFPIVVACKVTCGVSSNSIGTAPADSAPGSRESALGRRAHCQRTAPETWVAGFATSRHHADRCLVVHAKTVLGRLHHEYSLVPLALVPILAEHTRRRARTRISGVTVRPLWIASRYILR